MDLGIASGISSGLMQGFQTYMQTQNMLTEQAYKKKLANAQSVDAYSKLLDAGGSSLANSQLGNLGLLQEGAPQGQSPQTPQPTLTGGPQSAPLPSIAQGGAQAAANISPQGGTYLDSSGAGLYADASRASAAAMNLPRNQRGLILEPMQRRLNAQAELETPQGQLQYLKGQTDLANSKLNPQFQLKNEYDQQDLTKNARMAALNFQKLASVDPDSPISAKALMYNYLGVEQPGQAPSDSKLEDLKNNPNFTQNTIDWLSGGMKGTPTKETINDFKRAGAIAYQAVRNAQKNVSSDYAERAQMIGANPSFVTNDSVLTHTDNTANRLMKSIGPSYHSTVGQAATDMGVDRAASNIVDYGSKGLLNAGKGLMNNLSPPNTSNANAQSQTMNKDGHTYYKVKGGWSLQNPSNR